MKNASILTLAQKNPPKFQYTNSWKRSCNSNNKVEEKMLKEKRNWTKMKICYKKQCCHFKNFAFHC